MALRVGVERGGVERRSLREHDRGHPRAAVLVRQPYAVDGALRHARRAAQHVGNILRGDVLALPAKRVADAIDEVVVPIGVAAQQVAGPEPRVAGLEHVAQQLALGGRTVGVAVVLHGAGQADLAEQLAWLVGRAGDGAALRTARDVARRMIESHQRHLVLEQRMGLAHRADAAVQVLERDVALRGAIHLDDARDAEALLERRPDVGPQPGACGDPQAMCAIERRGWLAEQVAAELAHVHEGDGLMPADVVEERARRELATRRERPACPERRREADEEALAMVQRQGRVERLTLFDAEHLRQAHAPHGEPEVPDDGGLRVPRRTGSIDVEEHVVAADVGDVGLGRLLGSQVVERPHAGRTGDTGGDVDQETHLVAPRDLRQGGKGVGVADSRPGTRCLQHVSEARAADMGIDERANGSELRDRAQPDQEERAVQAEEGDRSSRTPTRPSQRGGEPIDLPIVGAVAELLRLELQGDSIGDALGLLADEATERIGRSTKLLDDLPEVHRRSASRALVDAASMAENRRQNPPSPSCRLSHCRKSGMREFWNGGAMALAAVRGIRSTRRGPAMGAARLVAVGARSDDAELAVSFEAVYGRTVPAGGERRLLLAVLEDGIRTLLKYAGARRGRARTLEREALAWMLSDANSDVFAFASICETLEIDPSRLRGRVLARVRPVTPQGVLS